MREGGGGGGGGGDGINVKLSPLTDRPASRISKHLVHQRTKLAQEALQGAESALQERHDGLRCLAPVSLHKPPDHDGR